MLQPEACEHPVLARGLGFWQATAINITQIVGAGVFATIPLILGVLPGVYGLLAWFVAGALILADGMIWGELGAALPAAGGSYHFLLESFGRTRWGRLMAFLFVWQILLSGPLEIGSGLVAAAMFSTAIDPDYKAFDREHTREYTIELPGGPAKEDAERPDSAAVTSVEAAAPGETATSEAPKIGIAIGPSRFFGFALGVLMIGMLYRRIHTLGRWSVVLLLGVLGLIAWVGVEGALNFNPDRAFDAVLKPGERPHNWALALGLGMGLALYSYFGYYNICYLGGEVRDPARTIPRSILASALAVVVLFALVHLAIVGTVPWREARADPIKDNLTAEFMARVRGPWAAAAVTVCLVGSCFASAFSGLLGYSRVPYAAAREGHFFHWFDNVHAVHQIPHRALFLIGALVLFWSFFSLDAIISALLATRILEQFVAQVIAVIALRRRFPERARPWRMWLYPVPCGIALCGWIFVYATTGAFFMLLGGTTLVAGLVFFLLWSKRRGQWPFATVFESGGVAVPGSAGDRDTPR